MTWRQIEHFLSFFTLQWYCTQSLQKLWPHCSVTGSMKIHKQIGQDISSVTDDSCPLFVMISNSLSLDLFSSFMMENDFSFFLFLKSSSLGMTVLGIWSVGLEGVRHDISANGKIVNNLNMTLLSYSSLKQNITNELRFIFFVWCGNIYSS